MRNLRKILSAVLIVATVLSLGACTATPKSLDEQWSYKTDTEEYAPGVYLFSLFTAYDQAYGVLSDAMGDEFSESTSIMDIESTFDESGETYICRDWIKKEADLITRNLIAMDRELLKHELSLDPQTVETARQQAKQDWYVGPYYFDYGPEYSTSYESILAQYGISFDSYFLSSVNLANVKQEALFGHLYGAGGEMEVPQKEIEKYFNDNYTSYSYFTMPLFKTTQDSTGASTQTPMSEDQIKLTKTVLNSYAKLIDEGAKFESVVKTFMEYAKTETDPSVSAVENLDSNTSLPDEVVKELDKMKENTASVVYAGEENSQIAYFVYKRPLADSQKEYLEDEVNVNHILKSMKNKEFYEYLVSLTDTVECQVNEKYIEKCDPKMFEKLTQ